MQLLTIERPGGEPEEADWQVTDIYSGQGVVLWVNKALAGQ